MYIPQKTQESSGLHLSKMAGSSTFTATTLQSDSRARLLVVGYPSDYDLHHSNTVSEDNNNDHDESPLQSNDMNSQAPDWPDHYRRIPPYRPVNRNLDQSERRVYTNFGERAFLSMMFLGVRTNAVGFITFLEIPAMLEEFN